jgi:ArsR family transcriptional regulator
MALTPTELFSALAHDTRLRCLMLLLGSRPELCVCELTQAIGAVQPHISRHLAQLRELGLVVDRRDGLWNYYRINPDLPAWAYKVLRETAAGLAGREPYANDARALARMPNEVDAPRCNGSVRK